MMLQHELTISGAQRHLPPMAGRGGSRRPKVTAQVDGVVLGEPISGEMTLEGGFADLALAAQAGELISGIPHVVSIRSCRDGCFISVGPDPRWQSIALAFLVDEECLKGRTETKEDRDSK